MFDLVTAGEAYDDFVFYNLTTLPSPGRELKTDAFVRTSGGGAVITAVAASRLGLRCGVVSALSDEAVALLRRERVNVVNLRRAGEPPALTVALSTTRDRRYVTFNGVNDRLPPRLRAALPRVRARHVHLSFYPRPCRQWIRVVERLRRRSITTSLDFGWNPVLARDRDLLRLCGAVDVLFLNREEAKLYARRSRIDDAIARWRRLANLVVVKLGRAGARVVGGDLDVYAPAAPARVVDTTGAGDVFDAGFLAQWLKHEDLCRAVVFANRLGAKSTERAGGV